MQLLEASSRPGGSLVREQEKPKTMKNFGILNVGKRCFYIEKHLFHIENTCFAPVLCIDSMQNTPLTGEVY
jgi:hypothetical protein